ncbi:MAG: MBL fold metallo-hydrolase [Verrucomicrobia bacterium]|nr:MBL fold metallo-hydrolase [Verrucomicrobiota bacterium]MDA1005279.1 MBL fold metallo-hydrolase [Verrucomicrobiota bacterium]
MPRHGPLQILKWKLGMSRREAPAVPDAPDTPAAWMAVEESRLEAPPMSTWQLTWLGHASWLLQLGGANLLIDPVFSEYCAPVRIPSLRRQQGPGVLPGGLPGIDGVLLTHSHYDHLDLPTLRNLPGNPPLVVPEGHREWLRGKGFGDVTELAWGDSCALGRGLTVHATPAQHFTARTPFDRDRGHWCGWVVEGGGMRIYFAGDTGYAPLFGDIARRHAALDLAVLPIGAYAPRWLMRPIHLDPEEAVRAHLELGPRCSVASHWGTFRLTDEALGEPPIWLARACDAAGVARKDFRVLKVGETLSGEEV